MSDNMAAWLRTVVPTGWGALVTFLLSRLPAVHEILVNPAVTMFVTGLVVAAWYSLWKWLEPRLPHWVRAFVLGYDRRPVYHIGEIRDAAYDSGYQAGQDEAVRPALLSRDPEEVPPAVLEAFKRSWEEQHRQADPPRSIARPGEDSGPRALTDVMPAVRDEDPAPSSPLEETPAETIERERRERGW